MGGRDWGHPNYRVLCTSSITIIVVIATSAVSLSLIALFAP